MAPPIIGTPMVAGLGFRAAGGLRSTIQLTQPGSLFGYWPCDDASGPVEELTGGAGGNLAITDADASSSFEVTGQVGPAITFDAGDFADNTGAAFDPPNDEGTSIFLLFRHDGPSGSRRPLGGVTTASDSDAMRIQADDGTLQLWIKRSNSIAVFGGTSIDVLTGWHAVILRRTSGGVLDYWHNSTTKTNLGSNSIHFTSAVYPTLGGADGFNNIQTTVQHFAVWRAGLTDAEVSDIMAETGLA